jgi:hypothetical protein
MSIRVTGRANANPSGAVTSVSVVLPATINAGDVIYIAALCSGATNANMFPVPLGLKDFNLAFVQQGGGSTEVCAYYYYKVANGDEGGTTITWSKSANEVIVEAGVIAEADLRYGPVFAGAGTVAANNAPDPPNLTPPWGSAEYLWQTATVSDDGNSAMTGGPSTGWDFTEILNEAGADTAGIYSGYADRVETAASKDPAAYAKVSNEEWAAITAAWLGATAVQTPPVAWHSVESLTGTTNDVTITIPTGKNLRLIVGVSRSAAPTAVTLDPAGLNLPLQLVDDGSTTASHADGGTEFTTVWELPAADLPAAGGYTLRISFAAATQRSAAVLVLQGIDAQAVESVTITVDDSAMASFTVASVAASCTLLTYACRVSVVNTTEQPFATHDLDGYPMVQYGFYHPNANPARSAVPMVRSGLAPGSHTLQLDAQGTSAVVAITLVFKEAPQGEEAFPHYYAGDC